MKSCAKREGNEKMTRIRVEERNKVRKSMQRGERWCKAWENGEERVPNQVRSRGEREMARTVPVRVGNLDVKKETYDSF